MWGSLICGLHRVGPIQPVYEYGSTPVRIGTGTNWATVSAGETRTLAIKANGTLWELYGITYTQIGTSANWASVSAGGFGIRTNGSLWNWASYSQVGTATNWVSVVTGHQREVSVHVNALRRDGTIWRLQAGMHGFNTVRIGTGTNWASPAVNGGAIRGDGTIWLFGWGSNDPVQLGGDTNWVYVSGNMAIRSDGTLWQIPMLWQISMYGYARQIGTDANWKSVSSGEGHSVAIRTDGTMWAWGRNNWGQLGDGTGGDHRRLIPTQILP